MRICVDRGILGTGTNLVINSDGSCEWKDVECDAYLYSRDPHANHLEDFARMCGMATDNFSIEDQAQLRALESLGADSHKIPWVMALGRRRFTSRIKKVVHAIQQVTGDPDIAKYVETYRQGNELLRALRRPRIDMELMRAHRESLSGGPAVLSALSSFAPEDDGLAPAVSYDRAATATGRLIVTHGPKILTLAKECRNIIKSRTGGAVYEIDFVSLEPRVALNVMGIQPARDIYEGIRERMHMSKVTRAAVKQAVISALYGSSSSALVEALGGRREAQGLVREVKEYFHVSDLAARLRSEMSESGGRMHNYFGRPLLDIKHDDPDSKLISYYVQSSAVDISLLGFRDFTARVTSRGVVPIYVIHDAILLDVPPGAEEALQQECSLGVDLGMGHFELGLKRVS